MKVFTPGYLAPKNYSIKKSIELKYWTAFILLLVSSTTMFGQIAIPSTTAVTQNFNAVGTSATASLPANWKMSPEGGAATATWGNAGNFTATTQQASSGTPTTGGRYNWGNGITTTDRAIGFLTSGSGYISPNSIMAWYSNTNSIAISTLTIAYDLERYKINTAAASVSFFYSTDGSTWTAVSGGDIAAAALPVSTGALYDFNPSGTPSATVAGVVSKTAISITGLNIAPAASIYLRWNINTTGANSQGIGIDNVSVVAGFTGSAIILSDNALTGFTYLFGTGPSAAQTFTVGAANLSPASGNITVTAPASYEVSLDGTNFFASRTIAYASNVLSPAVTVYIRLKAGLAIGTYNESATISGADAPDETVACTGAVTNFYNSLSDIIAVASSEAATISSTQNTAAPLTSATGTQAWAFTIRDGGAAADADNLPTIVSSIICTPTAGNAVSNWSQAIKTISLFNGTTLVATGTVTTNQVQFTGLSITVPDNGSVNLTVRLSLNCGIGGANKDGDDFGFSILSANFTTAASTSSSQKASFTASSADAKNIIDVVATKLIFSQQPGSAVSLNSNFSPAVIVTAQDNCGNTDKDYTGSINITSTGTLISSPQTATASAGIASFSGISFTVAGGPYTLTAAPVITGLATAVSNPFTVTTSTVLGAGDLMIVGFDTYVNGAPDLLSIANFVPILPTTSFTLANMVYDYLAAANVKQDRWYNGNGNLTISPPYIKLTYNGSSNIPAGAVICISLDGNGIVTAIKVNGADYWSSFSAVNNNGISCKTDGGSTTWSYVNFASSSPDAIFLMQGTFSADINDGSGNLYKTFTGSVFGGIQTYNSFQSFSVAGNAGGTRVSRIHPQMECVAISTGTFAGNAFYGYYNAGSLHTGSHRNLIKAIAAYAGSNWTKNTTTGSTGDGDNLATNNTCTTGFTVTSNVSPGLWSGETSADWFNCSNWDDFTVPTAATDVLITNAATNNAVIDYTSAKAAQYNYMGDAKSLNIIGKQLVIKYTGALRTNTLNVNGDLTINTNAGLNMNDGAAGTADGRINLAGNWTNNFAAGFAAGESLINFNSTTGGQTITSPDGEIFYNLTNTNTSTGLALSSGAANVTVNSILSLSNGLLAINSNTLTLNGTLTGTGTLTGSSTSNLAIGGTAGGSLGTINFTSGSQLLNTITVNRTGVSAAATLGTSLSVGTLATITAGILDAGTNTFNGAADITMTGGELQLAKNGTTLPELSGTYTLTGGTVNFKGTGTQTIRPVNYYNLTSTATGGRVMSSTGTVGIANIFTTGSNAYTFTNSTVDYNGAASQAIAPFVAGAAPGSTYNNLTLSNGTSVKSLTAATDVEGDLTLNNSITLSLGNNFLNLKSTSTKTARVAPVSASAAITYGTGKFVVERYYPAKRAWRLITAPVTVDASKTLFNAWQVGGATPVGSGTYISGPNETTANGLDVTPQHNYSLKIFNAATSQFDGVVNTKTKLISGTIGGAGVPDNFGYFMFVRGDRTPANVDAFNQYGTVVETTLRDTGKIQVQSYTFDATPDAGSNKYTLIGNPYASPVDFTNLARTGVANKFWAWDPKLTGTSGVGGYAIVDLALGNVTTVPAGGPTTQTQIIQSSQAFLIETTNATSPKITFTESDKSATNNLTLFRPAGTISVASLAANLYAVNADGSTTFADGTLAQFDNNFSNGIDYLDALKFGNVNETFGIVASNNFLMLQRCKPVSVNDSICFKLTKATRNKYRFNFIADRLPQYDLAGFLEDKYLHISTPVNMNGSTWIDMEMNNEAASRASNRFSIVFKKAAVYTMVNAVPSNADILVSWSLSEENDINHYEIERSVDGINFTSLHQQTAISNHQPATYNWKDEKPQAGTYYYRIKSISNNGVIGYSEKVKVILLKNNQSLYVFPNPVTNNIIQLQLIEKLAGNYTVRLLSSMGQLVKTQQFTHPGGTATLTINAGNISSGTYNLEVTAPGNKITNIKVLVKSK